MSHLGATLERSTLSCKVPQVRLQVTKCLLLSPVLMFNLLPQDERQDHFLFSTQN